MNPEETMVEENFDNEVADDALPEGVVEDTDESEEDLELILDEEEAEAQEPAEETKQPVQQASEPGWIKKRVNDAVEKALARERANIQAEYDAKYAPLMERMLEMDAQELVRSGKVKDLETAKELVRYRNNQPAAARPAETQPRNAQGQFASKDDVATTARIDMLKHQADAIRAKGGPDVIAEFQKNPEIKNKVIRGEMDFHDVADYLNNQKPSGKRPPSPMRSPNGVNGTTPVDFASMSDKQFERIEKRIQEEGVRYRLR